MNEFNEAMFITKVDNIFVKLYTCIMKQDLSDVKHFISDELELYYENLINELKNKGHRQMYDELNVKNTRILKRVIENGFEKVTVELTSRYMDYIIDVNTLDTISGVDDRRVEKINILEFEKKENTKKIGIVRICPGCGTSIGVNASGKCPYCDTIFNQEDYDYVLIGLRTI